MKSRTLVRGTAVATALLLFLLAGGAHAAPEAMQTIALKTGWNAVFLEVEPPDRDPAKVFEGFPAGSLSSAWLWLDKNTTVQFIQNPSEGEWEQSGWFGYRPGQPAFSNLHAVPGGRAYLVKMNQDHAWTLTGRPAPRRLSWVPDSFNYVGVHLDPAGPAPSFAAFFADSPAHQGQAIYRLNNATGSWRFVDNPAAETMIPGEAFWIRCERGSDYQGPLDVELAQSGGIDFGLGGEQSTLAVANRSGGALTVIVDYLAPAPPAEILLHRVFADRSYSWEPIGTLAPIVLEAGEKRQVVLSVRRELLAVGASFETVLSIASSAGDRVLVPVSARR